MGNPFRGWRRILILAAVAAGLAAATFLAMHYGIPYRRHLEIQRLLKAFRADPSNENLSPIADVLVAAPVSQEDAEDVARVVLDLKVATEKSYRPGAPVEVTLNSKFGNLPGRWPGANSIVFLWWKATLHVPGHAPAEGNTAPPDPAIAEPNYDGVFRNSRYVSFPTVGLADPGVHPATLVFEATLAAKTPDSTLSYGGVIYVEPGMLDRCLLWLGLKQESRSTVFYPCTLEVPLEIRFEDAAGQPPSAR